MRSVLAQRRLAAAALQHADVLLGRADQPVRVAAGRDDVRVAVVGQDPIWASAAEPLEVGAVESRPRARRRRSRCPPACRRRAAAARSGSQTTAASSLWMSTWISSRRSGRRRSVRRSSKVRVGRTSGSIPGGPASSPPRSRPGSREQLRGARGGDDLAVGEGRGPRDVVEVPMAEQDDEPRRRRPQALRACRACSTETCVS